MHKRREMNYKKLFWFLFNNRGTSETTETTMTETIPTAVSAALLQISEMDIVRPLVTTYPFAGPGVVHSTPIVSKLTAESDHSLSNQAIDSGTYTGSPSQATVGMHGSTVFLKELAMLGSVDDLMAMAGQLIGQSIGTVIDSDLCALFSSFTQNEGAANTAMIPSDVLDAYNFLRGQVAPLPYYLVLHPGHIWSSKGLTSWFSNTADANHFATSGGVGSVAEDIMRTGFSGMVFGFNVFADTNVSVTSRDASGAAFSRNAIKFVEKRPFRIDVLYNGPETGWQVTGSEAHGEAVLKNNFGDEMLFLTAA
jgi:hypothetical protein